MDDDTIILGSNTNAIEKAQPVKLSFKGIVVHGVLLRQML